MVKKDDVPLYANRKPFMLATASSFDALNDALEAKYLDRVEDYIQMRPNISLKGKMYIYEAI